MASLFLTCLSAANADFEQTNLVSDGFIAAEHFDPNLVNAWGLSLSPTGPFWVANNGTGTSTLYDGEGNAFPPGNPLIVDVLPTDDSSPTGTVFNSTEGFRIASMGLEGPSRFLFVSEEGRITGWNPDVDPMHALVAVDNSSRMAVYKGLALARNGRGTYIYATNFRDGVVEVYDSRFRWVTNFTDPNMESGYAPFGIQTVGQRIIVTYAKQDDEHEDDVAGPGNGFVDVFLPNGHLLHRLISHGALNSPWGVAKAPAHFGDFRNLLLIGNFGDGTINAYRMNGDFVGTMTNEDGEPMIIDGLWALMFGNGVLSDKSDLYFTAGPEDETHGVFGEIEAD
jgi:uncharacterized protein (TIGR03118 family)